MTRHKLSTHSLLMVRTENAQLHLRDGSFQILEHDLYNNPIETQAAFLLALGSETLVFACAFPQVAPCPYACGDFREYLWEAEVAELFLGTDLGQQYVEFNLSPEGAWWSCRFDRHRDRSAGEPTPIPGVRAFSSPRGSGRLAGLEIPLKHLVEVLGDVEHWTGNVTSILTVGDKRQFLSWSPWTEGARDYHNSRLWVPVEIHRSSR